MAKWLILSNKAKAAMLKLMQPIGAKNLNDIAIGTPPTDPDTNVFISVFGDM